MYAYEAYEVFCHLVVVNMITFASFKFDLQLICLDLQVSCEVPIFSNIW